MAEEKHERPVSNQFIDESAIIKRLEDMRDIGIKDWTDRRLNSKLKSIKKISKAASRLVSKHGRERLSNLAL